MKRIIGFKGVSIAILILTAAVIISIHITQIVGAASEDELVIASQDYVDEQIGILMAEIDSLKAQIAELQGNTSGPSLYSGFKVVVLKVGEQLIGEEGTEIVVRAGRTTAIAAELGGLADVTSDIKKDLMTGMEVPENHLLIISRSDGRGIKSVDNKDVYLLVKGSYTILKT
jgi:uncharacterized small protein (DUF1192 family)